MYLSTFQASCFRIKINLFYVNKPKEFYDTKLNLNKDFYDTKLFIA